MKILTDKDRMNHLLYLSMLFVALIPFQRSNAAWIYWRGSSNSEVVDGWLTLAGSTFEMPLDEGYLVSLYEWESDGGDNGFGFNWENPIASTNLERAPAGLDPWKYYFWNNQSIAVSDNTDLITVIYNSDEIVSATFFMICDEVPFNSGNSLISVPYHVAIPEPSTVSLLGTASVIIWTIRKRRKNRIGWTLR